MQREGLIAKTWSWTINEVNFDSCVQLNLSFSVHFHLYPQCFLADQWRLKVSRFKGTFVFERWLIDFLYSCMH